MASFLHREAEEVAEPIEPNRVYTLAEACEILSLPQSTFRLLVKRGEIKGWKAGRQWRFLGQELLAAVKKGGLG